MENDTTMSTFENKSEEVSKGLEQLEEDAVLELDEAEKTSENGAETNETEEFNLDKEENEFVVWADDTEEIDEDKKKAEEGSNVSKVTKEFGIEMSKEADELLVTWNGKEIKVPCKEEVSRDLRYYSRQLHFIAHPICFADLEDPALRACLKRAVNVAMEINEAIDGPPIKGFLRMKFNSMADVLEAKQALMALPPFPPSTTTPAPTTTTNTTTTTVETNATTTTTATTTAAAASTTTEAATSGSGEAASEVKTEEVAKVDGSGDKEGMEVEASGDKEGGEGGGSKDKEEGQKREINIVVFTEHISESHIMSKIKCLAPAKDALASRLLYVANIGLEISEPQLSEHFSGCERVIMPARDNKNKGYAYVQYATAGQAKEALEAFKQKPTGDNWFVIAAIEKSKAETGLLKDELRSYWLEQVRNLEATDRSSKSAKELDDLDQKLLRYKKRIITDNTMRQEFGFVIAESELYVLPEGVVVGEGSKKEEKSRERSKEKSRERRSSRRRRTPPKYPRRFERGRPSRGSGYAGPSVRRGSQMGAGNEGGMLVSQLQQLVGALSNNMSQQLAPNRSISSQNNNFSNISSFNPSQFSNFSSSGSSRSNLPDDRLRYSGGGVRGRYDNYDHSDRKRRYDDGDRYGGRYNNDYRGNGY